MGLSGPIIPCKVAAAGDERYLVCAAVGSDVRPGFRWRPWVSASFAWQAWDHVHCQGVGCTPRGSAGVPGSPPLLRGRRGTMCTVKGSDVRPGVPLASLGLRLFCVAGVGRSTKPCVFPRKVAAAGDERYLVCAAVAAAVVWFLLCVLQQWLFLCA